MKKYFLIVFAILALNPIFSQGNKESTQTQDVDYNYEVSIDNMTCGLCDVAVEKQLSKLDWIQAVNGDHKTGLALLKIENAPDTAEMKKIINKELKKINYNFVSLRSLDNG